jgi:hypothetical protein
MKSLYPWFPVMFPDETGRNNIMINFYIPFMHKNNFVMEIAGKGMKLCLDTMVPPIFLTRQD